MMDSVRNRFTFDRSGGDALLSWRMLMLVCNDATAYRIFNFSHSAAFHFVIYVAAELISSGHAIRIGRF